jgi:hypothetical protein
VIFAGFSPKKAADIKKDPMKPAVLCRPWTKEKAAAGQTSPWMGQRARHNGVKGLSLSAAREAVAGIWVETLGRIPDGINPAFFGFE